MSRLATIGAICGVFMLALAGSAPALGTPEIQSHGVSVYYGSYQRALALSGNAPALARLAAPSGTCGPAADDPNAAVAAQDQAMECLVNFARQQAGMPKLADSRKLDGSADNKAADIMHCNSFSHEACGRDFLYWFRRGGYIGGDCWWAGENLAWGTGSLGSASSIVKAWLHSPSHRANLLGGEYVDFGISLRIGGLSGSSDAHVWVNHFGRHC
jgi:uncharacterized protein YkwD